VSVDSSLQGKFGASCDRMAIQKYPSPSQIGTAKNPYQGKHWKLWYTPYEIHNSP
jgi:hypothetical protein